MYFVPTLPAIEQIVQLPGKPHVLAIAFVNSPATELARDLKDANLINLNIISRAYFCPSLNGSAIFFVPFPDLVAQRPELALKSVFDRLDEGFAELERKSSSD